MLTLHDVEALRRQRAAWRSAGSRVALVPTMGNLHAGHLSLIEAARQRAERVVATIFVNPLQFGAGEDYERYPRTLDADAAALAAAGCDLLFAPPVEAIYPRGRAPITAVQVPEVSEGLCAAQRPGHFTGVATVVNLLFNLVQPDLAVFGEKDYQQLQVIRRMVADLHMPVEILGRPTARDVDGLALSSRNGYLSEDERRRAPALYRALCTVADGLRAGRRDFTALQAEAEAALQAAGLVPQYVEIRATDLGRAQPEGREFVVLAAALAGNTRLIDNLVCAS